MKMRYLPIVLLGFLTVPALAQSPTSVPLRNNTPSPETTLPRPSSLSPNETRSADTLPNARNHSDGRVAPPSSIDTPVQIIAPERKP